MAPTAAPPGSGLTLRAARFQYAKVGLLEGLIVKACGNARKWLPPGMILLLLPPAKSTQKRGFGAPEQLRRLVRAVDLWLAPKYNSRHLPEANRYQDKS